MGMAEATGTTPVRGEGRAAPRRIGFGHLLPAAIAAGVLIGALVLPGYILRPGTRPVPQGLGPDAWPLGLIGMLAVLAVVWTAREIWAVSGTGRRSLLTEAQEEEGYSHARAVMGLVLIVAYGALIPVTGFALTTAVFIALWCRFGGIVSPLAIAGVSLLGTAGLLWVFMGLALMPLSRGIGLFDELSVALLRLLGIY
jgi:putative tricarboxylic transport membrane protein